MLIVFPFGLLFIVIAAIAVSITLKEAIIGIGLIGLLIGYILFAIHLIDLDKSWKN